MKYNEKTIDSKKIYNGKVLRLRVDEVVLNNGHKTSREIVEHNGAVAIIPILDGEKMFLVKQFRKAIEQELIELPAGKIEKGEDPKESALRELEEEIGYKAGSIEKIFSIYTSPGFSNEIIHIYVAKNLIKTKTDRDEDELMDVIVLDFEEVKEMINKREIMDAKSIVGILAYFNSNNEIY